MSEQRALQYAGFNFDVHDDKSLYTAVYKELGPHAIPNGSASSYLVLFAHKDQIINKMEQINFKAKSKGKLGVTYKIRRTHPDEATEVRADSVNELHSHVAFITQSMLDRIDRLEKKFNEKTDDVNEMIQKRNDAISKAGRQLDEARGLAMLFLIDKEVSSAVEAAKMVAEAQATMRDALKVQYADEIKKLKAKAKAEREAATSAK